MNTRQQFRDRPISSIPIDEAALLAGVEVSDVECLCYMKIIFGFPIYGRFYVSPLIVRNLRDLVFQYRPRLSDGRPLRGHQKKGRITPTNARRDAT
jgi:hypothetical protein